MRIYIIIILTLGFIGCSSDLNTNSDDVSLPASSSDSDPTSESFKFVAVGDSGTILTSSDGTSWTSITSGISNNLRGITHGNSTFVAVGQSGTILTSSDSTSWTSRTSGTSKNF